MTARKLVCLMAAWWLITSPVGHDRGGVFGPFETHERCARIAERYALRNESYRQAVEAPTRWNNPKGHWVLAFQACESDRAVEDE